MKIQVSEKEVQEKFQDQKFGGIFVSFPATFIEKCVRKKQVREINFTDEKEINELIKFPESFSDQYVYTCGHNDGEHLLEVEGFIIHQGDESEGLRLDIDDIDNLQSAMEYGKETLLKF